MEELVIYDNRFLTKEEIGLLNHFKDKREAKRTTNTEQSDREKLKRVLASQMSIVDIMDEAPPIRNTVKQPLSSTPPTPPPQPSNTEATARAADSDVAKSKGSSSLSGRRAAMASSSDSDSDSDSSDGRATRDKKRQRSGRGTSDKNVLDPLRFNPSGIIHNKLIDVGAEVCY